MKDFWKEAVDQGEMSSKSRESRVRDQNTSKHMENLVIDNKDNQDY